LIREKLQRKILIINNKRWTREQGEESRVERREERRTEHRWMRTVRGEWREEKRREQSMLYFYVT